MSGNQGITQQGGSIQAATIAVGDGAKATGVDHSIFSKVTHGDGSSNQTNIGATKTIQCSAHRVAESAVDDALKKAIEQLTQQVGVLVEKLDQESAQEAADALETLTKEVVRSNPRRAWWELSLQGLKDAAVAVNEIGAPVFETVKIIASLLAR